MRIVEPTPMGAGHETEVTEYKRLSNGQWGLLIRCCGDDSHSSWLTIAASVMTDTDAMKAALDKHCQMVADIHEASIHALHKMPDIIGSKRSHD